jgi:hypothetical protein
MPAFDQDRGLMKTIAPAGRSAAWFRRPSDPEEAVTNFSATFTN